ncbi:uncharacterized protein LOC125048383 [Penaeus chinensis]|uniref:uncharacterized protein LOC125048383 n=1 Tax=Penaeus chinensis TaxID=139456 RepID=UPI001FB7BBD2|nr:uncharacterized protein LOC125048383 [Penaeus chinensis]
MRITMLIRLLKIIIKSVILTILFVLLVHHLKEDHVTPTSSPTLRYWDRNALKVKGRYSGYFLPYIVTPLLGESLREGTLKEIYPTIERSFLADEVRFPAGVVKDYVEGTVPSYSIKRASSESSADALVNRKLTKIKDYFDYLQHPRLRCRKLKRMGGTYSCDGQGDEDGMDGHKYVCMDPSLELGGTKDPKSCLTLSYGVHKDATFDGDVAELQCEVHMFDVLNFNPLLAHEVDHVHFHVEGLARKTIINFYPNVNMSVEMNDVLGHMLKYKLDPRPVNILKIDIEGSEWDALADVTTKEGLKILELVGQIAIELHVVDLVQELTVKGLDSKPPDQWLDVLQKRFDILMGLEDMGFRPVVYWDNVQDKFALHDEAGVRYETAGEVLFVNTNWYNATFKRTLVEEGVMFRGDFKEFIGASSNNHMNLTPTFVKHSIRAQSWGPVSSISISIIESMPAFYADDTCFYTSGNSIVEHVLISVINSSRGLQ